jgi:VCBS repeat-containing protein
MPSIGGGDNTIALSSDGSTLSASGSFSVTDTSLSDAVNLDKRVSVGGTTTATAPILPSQADLLAMLSLNPSTVLQDATSTTADVTWNFNSGGQDFAFLAEGETLVLTYTLTATDTGTPPSEGSTTVTLIITGRNDRPTLAVPQRVSLVDTAADDSFVAATGTLQAADADHNAMLSYSIAGQTAGNHTIGGSTFTASKVGRYGTLYIDNASGAYAYVPSDSAIEALQADSSDVFSLRVSDGSLSATQSLEVLITGRNDTPDLSPVSALSHTDSSADDSFSTASGQLVASDRDGDTLSYQISGQTAEVNLIDGIRYDVKKTGRLGTVYLVSDTGAYRFVPDDAALEGLQAAASENFGLVASDGAALTTRLLTINVSASNDTPSLGASTLTHTYTDTAGADRFASVTGSLSSNDRDRADSAVFSATHGSTVDSADSSRSGYDRSLAGSYGTLYLNRLTGAYEYVPLDSAINALTANASDSFGLNVIDGNNASAGQTLVVSLVGANDTPALQASLPSTTYVNTGASESFAAVTGSLSSSDRDSGAALTYGMVGETLETNSLGGVTYNRKAVGNFGTLYLSSSTGAYRYVPSNT